MIPIDSIPARLSVHALQLLWLAALAFLWAADAGDGWRFAGVVGGGWAVVRVNEKAYRKGRREGR